MYKDTQKTFDELPNSKKCAYTKAMLNKIERFNTTNHKDFGDHLNSLGPKKAKPIRNAVKINGTITADHDKIMQKWTSDFKEIYNKPDHLTKDFDLTFKLAKESVLGSRLPDETFGNTELNNDFTQEEIKAGKATGLDNIPNEILKMERNITRTATTPIQCMFHKKMYTF